MGLKAVLSIRQHFMQSVNSALKQKKSQHSLVRLTEESASSNLKY